MTIVALRATGAASVSESGAPTEWRARLCQRRRSTAPQTAVVFQKGVGADLLGFQQVEVIQTGLPLFLFAILFGLFMDYHVFLLSRVRERFIQTGDNSEAVAYGLRSTGRLITGVALIMVADFGGFALGDLVAIQQMGFGLAVAVLIDATIVRSILVPAAMALLGDRN